MGPSDKIIPLWLIVYDQDPNRTYLFTHKDKVLASIEGLARSEVPDIMGDECADHVATTLKHAWGSTLITMQLISTTVHVHRLEIDKCNPIHQVLVGCKAALNTGVGKQEAIGRIDDLFIDPATLY